MPYSLVVLVPTNCLRHVCELTKTVMALSLRQTLTVQITAVAAHLLRARQDDPAGLALNRMAWHLFDNARNISCIYRSRLGVKPGFGLKVGTKEHRVCC